MPVISGKESAYETNLSVIKGSESKLTD